MVFSFPFSFQRIGSINHQAIVRHFLDTQRCVTRSICLTTTFMLQFHTFQSPWYSSAAQYQAQCTHQYKFLHFLFSGIQTVLQSLQTHLQVHLWPHSQRKDLTYFNSRHLWRSVNCFLHGHLNFSAYQSSLPTLPPPPLWISNVIPLTFSSYYELTSRDKGWWSARVVLMSNRLRRKSTANSV